MRSLSVNKQTAFKGIVLASLLGRPGLPREQHSYRLIEGRWDVCDLPTIILQRLFQLNIENVFMKVVEEGRDQLVLALGDVSGVELVLQNIVSLFDGRFCRHDYLGVEKRHFVVEVVLPGFDCCEIRFEPEIVYVGPDFLDVY